MVILGDATFALSAYCFLASSMIDSTTFLSISLHLSSTDGSFSRSKLLRTYTTVITVKDLLTRIISIYRKINQYLNDESLEKLFVRALVVGDTKKVLSRRVFHGGDNVILCLKVLNPTSIQLRRVVAKERNGISLKPESKKMKVI